MKTFIKLHDDILAKVKFFSKQLKLKLCKSTGRPLAISGEETIALALFKQNGGIGTKKKIFEIFRPKESYKTLCVEMNRFALQALIVLNAILKWNQKYAHIIKHTDSTDIPVCLNKNAKYHQSMKMLSSWGHSGYLSKDLEEEFYQENTRILFTKPRGNMKKIITDFQYHLYNTRMLIELNFRNLKMFYAFITSMPRSIDGYLANYIYSLLAFVLR